MSMVTSLFRGLTVLFVIIHLLDQSSAGVQQGDQHVYGKVQGLVLRSPHSDIRILLVCSGVRV